MHTFRELKTFDTIEITAKELEKAINLYNSDQANKSFNFFLKEGVVKNEDEKLNGIQYVYFKINDEQELIDIEYYFYSREQIKLGFIFSGQIDIKKMKKRKSLQYNIIRSSANNIGASDVEAIELVLHLFLAVFQYLTHLISNRKTTIKEVKLKDNYRKTTSKSNPPPKKSVINISQDKIKYKITTNDKNAIENLVKREYARHTESWTVRGHTRTYKNGKTVYIKPHTRGKGKNKPKSYRGQ